jgi:hypothetical protein
MARLLALAERAQNNKYHGMEHTLYPAMSISLAIEAKLPFHFILK